MFGIALVCFCEKPGFMMRRALWIASILLICILFRTDSLSADYTYISRPMPLGISFQYADSKLWSYLRLGLNYLESPEPLSPPEAVPPAYRHPDLKGYGAYGFTLPAYEDVQRLYPFFKDYSWEDILHSQELYELANQAFADWLLKNLQDYVSGEKTEEQIFDALHKAWNVGLTGFRNGREVVPSRMVRAQEFFQLARQSNTLN